jgi:hypothetical protein
VGCITIDIYVNGVLSDGILSGTIPSSVYNLTTGSLQIGTMGSGFDGWFNGTIDDVRIYNRALSASEIWRLYNGAP